MRRPFLAAATLSLVTSACDPPPDVPTDARVTRDTIDGVVHLISGDRGAWIRGGSWNVDRTGLLIGDADGPDEYTFGAIAGVAIGAAGRIYVGDAIAGEVRVFDPDGTFRFRMGRSGEGPGEFRNISAVTPTPDGIAVLDGRLGRVTVFDPDGTVLRSFRLRRPHIILDRGAPIRVDRAGRVYDPVQVGGRDGDRITLTVYDVDGGVLDTLLLDVVERQRLVVERDGTPIMGFPLPFDPSPSVAVAPDGRIFFARGEEYRILALSPAGDTLHVLRRRVRPPPVTARDRDSALALIEERYRQAAGAAPPRVELPATKPAVAELLVDDEGYLWVGRSGDAAWAYREWGIHHPDGHYLGAVATPRMRVMHIGADRVAGVTVDDDGVERVAVFRLRR